MSKTRRGAEETWGPQSVSQVLRVGGGSEQARAASVKVDTRSTAASGNACRSASTMTAPASGASMTMMRTPPPPF